jgi:hypothetical protein
MRTLTTISLTTIFLLVASAASAGPLDRFAGRWTGWGQLSTVSGVKEKLKCVTTYMPAKAGTAARQNFRCTSASYRLDAVVDYAVDGGQLTGTWRERIYSAGGPLQGTINGGSISMIARSETFVTRVRINASRCSQSINIEPSGGVEISEITVDLRRC